MSRVAKNPVAIPAGVEVKFGAADVTVKGALGSLSTALCNDVEVKLDNGQLTFAAKNDSKFARAMSGTLRALLNNMVNGVSKGFEKKLQLVGVGYRAQAQGDTLNLSLGFSHPVAHKMPAGIKVETPTQTEILVKGADKQLVGQVAAEIRAYRSPEPYKGKGVRYADEVVVLKETKKK
ncbi:50S ribosomal protein L6 [Chromobacterium violaceum]|uniref:Large ribosomal subunit protein uL6 n=2 Tax=Chromobacterium violaceum TaxID=536 RepID=RL6_CHRVO|nr:MULTISPECIES: 50S ribosomal protein L6 [Chromobacterium]Q7NQG7.1 RecName: Full=Large ribosomal subunit protein uL6; AltName: Full=50S ribosomal protein L6 [Chromobacterium violaceum ATCC 12472]AAQ61831.1 50S ribosomal protein L6 [Chromobacterium violaceum ATCC 12472]ATP30355.1 50S ribosomal protein L6 [Chromobacterium violaceum]ATP34263.1 50S ribosomal protein L6 [Chromobacterium violaceum]KJH65545.1 50S ribosomal protein L6 [Chromobacterium violaceum]KMN49996.1 50S ribosomal protein L6 [C